MKVIVGLGNPGAEYDDTRHNVGWWLLDRLAYDWGLDTFEKKRRALVTDGIVGETQVRLIKPTTFMNRSGAALIALHTIDDFDFQEDLLLVVDDATLEVGRVRFRRAGGSGGHNGLKSVSGALGTDGYARLRIGVGVCPPGMDLADWVLAPMEPEEEDVVIERINALADGVRVWMTEGIEKAMDRSNQ
jgi:peptidyl-tRNA hydrolase, PTH1 family